MRNASLLAAAALAMSLGPAAAMQDDTRPQLRALPTQRPASDVVRKAQGCRA